MTEPVPPVVVDVQVPVEVEAGVYANFVGLWQTPTEFVIDFASVIRPATLTNDETGSPIVLIPSKVIARVRIPPQQMFELMKACEQQLTAWENQNGPISTSDDGPLYPPDSSADADSDD
jgi:hypothetical protein